MIFFNRHLTTFWVFSVWVGKAFIHPKKVQANTSKEWGLFLAHRLYLLYIVLLTLESWVHKNVGPWWSRVLFSLSEFLHGTTWQMWEPRASDSGMAMQPWINFHHVSGRKLPPLVSNQACFCEVCHGSPSDKGHGNKAAVSEAKLVFLWGLLAWLSYQPFSFPEQLSSSLLVPLVVHDQYSLRAHTGSSSFRIFGPHLTLFSWVRSPNWKWPCF
jgi:hypothetical protein